MDIKDVENLANLARIELDEDEKRELLSDMKGILEYVKQVEKAEVGSNFAQTEDQRIHNVWREDEIEPKDFSKELITGQFPDAKDGFLKVKKIL